MLLVKEFIILQLVNNEENMSIVYSPSSHAAGASGFYFSDDKNAPADSFPVASCDQSAAINLPQGSTYSFAAPTGSAVSGTLSTAAPGNAYLLAQAQAVQISAIESAYETGNALPIAYMSTTFQADVDSQALIANVLQACGGSLPSGFEWYDSNNSGVVMSFAQLQGLAGTILMRGQPLFVNKQTKKALIKAATTVAAINAITF